MTTERRNTIFATTALALGVALFAYVYIVNAWTGDDPYITFRTIDNFVHGYGLVWNTDERVQAYTDPLWMFLLSGIYYFTREAYYSMLAVCFAASLGSIIVACRTVATTWWRRALLIVVLLASKAWVDYSSSGLENPLSYLLLASFFGPLLRDGLHARTPRRFAYYFVISALAFSNRADSSLLYAPALIALAIDFARANGILKLAWMSVVTMTPAWGWLVFSTIYYGFPFPNTAYSKLSAAGPSMPLVHPNGPIYYLNSLRWDPITLTVIAAATLLALVAIVSRLDGWKVCALTMAGALLYLAYTLRIGGDYMSGRFFTMPYLVATLVAVRLCERGLVGIFFGGLALSGYALMPRPPIFTTEAYERLPVDPTGILDEAGNYRHYSGIFVVLRNGPSPGRTSTPPGQRFRQMRPKTMVWGAIGYYGFAVGPETHVVDPIGLPDPLIARIPPRNLVDGWGRGHFFHDIPDGYVASQETGDNLVADPNLHAYYDQLRILTRGPIFSRERFVAIYRMNTGRYNHLVASYAAAQHR
ncbi:MAG: hypothetical protein ABI551_16730 [Polyangiaceae bacterium]